MPRWILMTLAAAAALTLYQIIRGGVSWLARQIEKSIKQYLPHHFGRDVLRRVAVD